MELKKENIHRDRVKLELNTQITLEEDKNISDRSPDASAILMDNGKVYLEEIKPMTDSLLLRGKLNYEILYADDTLEKRLYRIVGEIPFEEKIRVEGISGADIPQVQTQIEDFRTSLINSRKVNIRSLINFNIKIKELYDEEIPVGILEQTDVEVKKEKEYNSVLIVDKKDIYRIKEELELPSFLPPIKEVLWKSVELRRVDARVLEDSIGLQGEIHLFILYEGEGESYQIKSYDTTVPFSGKVECAGCGSSMVGDIAPYVSYQNLNIKADYDGEDRMLELEMVLEIPIQIYENRQMEMIRDVYGTERKLEPIYTKGYQCMFRDKCCHRMKLVQEIKTKNSDKKIMQICHMNSYVQIEETKVIEKNIEIQGIFFATILYLADGEQESYEVIKKEIPFLYEAEQNNINSNCIWKIRPMIEQQEVLVLDENSMEIKATVGFEFLIEEKLERDYITAIQESPFSKEIWDSIPSVVVCFPVENEEIWNIGKQYHIPVKTIKEINGLTTDEVKKGEKIILVR